MWIEPARVVDGRTFREIHFQLEAGSSLLDRTGFVWDEPYNCA